MRTDIGRWDGKMVLLLAHVAGMIDLVALPVWVGTALIGQMGFTAQRAGITVTTYLLSVVLVSVIFSSRFHRYKPARVIPAGFGIAALAFVAMTRVDSWAAITALHALGGVGTGLGLSFTHGIIGRSAQPHRLFAFVNFGLSISAIIFLVGAQSLVPQWGAALLFWMFAVLMALAALATAFAFPTIEPTVLDVDRPRQRFESMSPAIWCGMAGIALMVFSQDIVLSFIERIGTERGYGGRVVNVLLALSIANLLPPLLATWFERRISPMTVAFAGATAQAILALLIVSKDQFVVYALAVPLFPSMLLFTHTFVFGWLARHDQTGRAVALTPAMLMSGAAAGPVIGGGLVTAFGTGSLGLAVLSINALAVVCYVISYRHSAERAEHKRDAIEA